jgi:nucleoid DNA-binding protein
MPIKGDQPSCNQRLYNEVSKEIKIVSPQQVEEILSVTCEFMTKVIKEGGMETIMLPNFGKFKIKEKQLQYLADKNVTPKLI